MFVVICGTLWEFGVIKQVHSVFVVICGTLWGFVVVSGGFW